MVVVAGVYCQGEPACFIIAVSVEDHGEVVGSILVLVVQVFCEPEVAFSNWVQVLVDLLRNRDAFIRLIEASNSTFRILCLKIQDDINVVLSSFIDFSNLLENSARSIPLYFVAIK